MGVRTVFHTMISSTSTVLFWAMMPKEHRHQTDRKNNETSVLSEWPDRLQLDKSKIYETWMAHTNQKKKQKDNAEWPQFSKTDEQYIMLYRSVTGIVVVVGFVAISCGGGGGGGLIHALELNVLKSTNDAARIQFLQSFTTYTDNNAFLANAGASEWCVGFESFTADDEFETKSLPVRSDAGVTIGFIPFTIAQNPLRAVASNVANRISTAGASNMAVLFVNHNDGQSGEIKVDTTYTVPIASWRAEFQAVALETPSEGVKFTITLQTSAVTVAVTGIANGFFGFIASSDTKVQTITFEGAVNIGAGGESFEMDNVCGSSTHLAAPVPQPVQQPVQQPNTPNDGDDEDDDECFAAGIPLIGLFVCLLFDILLSLGNLFV